MEISKNGAVAAALTIALAATLFSSGCAGLADRRGPSALADAGSTWSAPQWLGDGGLRFEEGDILLVRSPEVFSALFARHGSGGDYSHAILVVRSLDDDAPMALHIMGRGLLMEPLRERLEASARVAVLRLGESDETAAARLRAASLAWIERDREQRLTFSLHAWEGWREQPLTFNCVGLVNRIYRDANLSEPFPAPPERPADEWQRLVRRYFDLDLTTLPGTGEVVGNPAFVWLGAGENPEFDPRILAVQDEIVDAVHGFALAGLEPRQPRGLVRVGLVLAEATGRISRKTRRQVEMRLVFADFARRVEKPARAYLRRRPRADEARLRALAERRSNHLRDRYFE